MTACRSRHAHRGGARRTTSRRTSIRTDRAPRLSFGTTRRSGTEGGRANNRLHGFVEEVRIGGLLSQVRLPVGDQMLTAVITADAVRGLKLRRGQDAIAIVKSTEVMIATPAE